MKFTIETDEEYDIQILTRAHSMAMALSEIKHILKKYTDMDLPQETYEILEKLQKEIWEEIGEVTHLDMIL